MQFKKYFLPVFILILMIQGCQHIPPPVIKDSAPNHVLNLDKIPDAVVKDVPKSRFGNPEYYEIQGKRYYVMKSATGFKQTGIGSWYGTKFHGRRTSSGEPYNMYAMTAAHKTLPLPTFVQVTNLDNGKKVVVKVNDRGPFHDDRIIDLSYAAASKLGYASKGTAHLEIEALIPGLKKSSSKEKYLVQIGAYSDQKKSILYATEVQQQLSQKVEISALQTSQQLFYRLRVGPFKSHREAQNWLQKILAKGFNGARIVTVSNRWQNL